MCGLLGLPLLSLQQVSPLIYRTAMKVSTVFLAAALALAPVVGFAQTPISQAHSSSTVELNNKATTYLVLPKFDPSMGTLQGVNISLSIDIGQYSALFTNGSSAVIASGDYLFTNTVSSVGSSLGATSLFSSADASVVKLGDFSINQAGNITGLNPGSSTSRYFDPTLITSGGDIGSSYIAQYAGVGSFTLDVSAAYAAGAWIYNSESSATGKTPSGQVFATVTYTFIPEPSTYAMVFGAITLCLVGWRRFRR